MAEGAMTAFLTNIGTFFTQAITWMGDVMTEVVADPALTILVLAIPICGVVFGYLRRLISL